METKEHRDIKRILQQKLESWFKASINEYESHGHRADLYAVTHDGVTIDVEVIWSPEMIKDDIILLHEIWADVKVIVVNPIIKTNEKHRRALNKLIVDQTNRQVVISGLIDGAQVLNDSEYANCQLKDTLLKLVEEARTERQSKSESLEKIGKIIWRISYPKALPLLAPIIKFPIDIAVKNDAEQTILTKLVIESHNKCLLFRPLRPIEVVKKKMLGLKSETQRFWLSRLDFRESMLPPGLWNTFTFHAVYDPQLFDFAFAKQLELAYFFSIKNQLLERLSSIGPYTEYITLSYPSDM